MRAMGAKEILGRWLYEDLTHANPMPDDLEWSKLDELTREIYNHAAASVIAKFQALYNQPQIDL